MKPPNPPPVKPRLLFVADGRSPIALNWIQHFVKSGYEVHLASTYPCAPDLRLASLTEVPVAFSGVEAATPNRQGKGSLARKLLPVGARTAIRQWLGPFTLREPVLRLEALLSKIQPDLVHAMRIPYEGILAALALEAFPRLPLLVSVWGNDFTLHAPAAPMIARYTRHTLRRASALHADCRRDLRLAQDWGFPDGRPVVVLPGGGGVQMDVFTPAGEPGNVDTGEQPAVINPRGFRAYVRNDTFFRSIPAVLKQRPDVRFLCPAMAGEDQARRWVEAFGVAGCVDLLPRQTRSQMADLFRRSQVAVSPTTHDGTPNTLLEAMACGCFPIAGDLESLREWITPGTNGYLVEPGDPEALAEAILLALEQPDLRRRAVQHNLGLIAERAEHGKVMQTAEEFYHSLVFNRPVG